MSASGPQQVRRRTSIGPCRSIHPFGATRDSLSRISGRGTAMTRVPGTVPLIVFGVGIVLLALEVVFILLVHHGSTWRERLADRRRRSTRSRSDDACMSSSTVGRDDTDVDP